ncbi:hypothetical protein [Streptomyces sp. 067-1]|uniref:hypothetical protein n=1 Tax=Streptomyces sp. 067-1 TaxID=2789269 RepID=UPI0039F4945B
MTALRLCRWPVYLGGIAGRASDCGAASRAAMAVVGVLLAALPGVLYGRWLFGRWGPRCCCEGCGWTAAARSRSRRAGARLFVCCR